MMPMIRTIAAMLLLILASGAARAQDDGGSFRIGDDAYFAGSSVAVETTGLDAVFAAGERVTLAAPTSGTAHLAGRRVEARADIGGDLYAAGAGVTVGAPVAGNASLAGYDVSVEAAIGGNLRAGGKNVRVAGPVGGTALIAGESVEIEGVITGDAAIAVEDLSFGPDAKVNGRLSLYGEDVNDIAVPASVVPAERVDRHAELPPEMRRIADRPSLVDDRGRLRRRRARGRGSREHRLGPRPARLRGSARDRPRAAVPRLVHRLSDALDADRRGNSAGA